MDRRDHFAATILAGMNASLSDTEDWPDGNIARNMALYAVVQADELIARLDESATATPVDVLLDDMQVTLEEALERADRMREALLSYVQTPVGTHKAVVEMAQSEALAALGYYEVWRNAQPDRLKSAS